MRKSVYSFVTSALVAGSLFSIHALAQVSPSSHDFGSRTIGLDSYYSAMGGNVSIGYHNDTGNTITIAATASSGFAVTGTCTGTLSPGQTCSGGASFSPSSTGSASGSVTITDTNTSQVYGTISLTGTGGYPTATVDTTSFDFGNIIVGQSSSPQAFTITNTSAFVMTNTLGYVSGYYFPGPYACDGTYIQAYTSCIVNIGFAPNTTGTISGTISVTTNATNLSSFGVSVTGVGEEGGKD